MNGIIPRTVKAPLVPITDRTHPVVQIIAGIACCGTHRRGDQNSHHQRAKPDGFFRHSWGENLSQKSGIFCLSETAQKNVPLD